MTLYQVFHIFAKHTTLNPIIMASIKYLFANEKGSQWRIITKTVGMQDVEVGSSYPIGDHPDGYLFSTERGRVLHEVQILYIIKGGGWFVSAHCERTELHAGDAVILYPHEWHSYAPNPATGWSEAWIGFTGENAERLVGDFFPDKSKPIHRVGIYEILCEAYEKAYEVAEQQLPAYQQQLAGYVTFIITTIYARSKQLPYLDNPDTISINFAKKIMRQNLHRNMLMQDVADQSGMGYSKFRKQFKEYTGLSPAQYYFRLKMECAKDYLLNTSLSCKEIAFRLGFDSASYFNKMFRLYQKQTPTEYRTSSQKN